MRDAFSRRHPAVNLMFFAAAAIFAMMFDHPVFIGISFSAALAYAVKLKGKAALKMFFCALLPLLIFVVLINTIFAGYGVTVLYTFASGKRITLESAVCGGVTGSLVVTMLLWFACFNEVVTEDKFMYAFGGRMPNTALMLLMVFRFVPLYKRQLSETLSARRAAGLAQSSGRAAELKNACAAVSGVITRALENAIETADSMKSRGYGSGRRTSYSRFTFSPADAVMIIEILVLSAVIAAGKLSGFAEASYNPIIEIGGFSAMLAVSAAAYAIFCFFPIIYDFAEDIRWNRLYAKT
ncbi:MAG: energy-coupling factor transporter transmembrane component T [Oscillospiraceae bacterium]|nr:energy-coupling factor transporter transmembrane component T [Oscillospiraceae bacterium]